MFPHRFRLFCSPAQDFHHITKCHFDTSSSAIFFLIDSSKLAKICRSLISGAMKSNKLVWEERARCVCPQSLVFDKGKQYGCDVRLISFDVQSDGLFSIML